MIIPQHQRRRNFCAQRQQTGDDIQKLASLPVAEPFSQYGRHIPVQKQAKVFDDKGVVHVFDIIGTPGILINFQQSINGQFKDGRIVSAVQNCGKIPVAEILQQQKALFGFLRQNFRRPYADTTQQAVNFDELADFRIRTFVVHQHRRRPVGPHNPEISAHRSVRYHVFQTISGKPAVFFQKRLYS